MNLPGYSGIVDADWKIQDGVQDACQKWIQLGVVYDSLYWTELINLTIFIL